MKYFFDTEFMEDGKTIELLSIGIVSENGREYYAESLDADWSHANEWVRANVLSQLDLDTHGKTLSDIGYDIVKFTWFDKPQFWAYYGAYDWIVLCQLYGRMVDLPEGWPMHVMDVKQLCVSLGDPRLPEQTSTAHHALADARWTRQAWEFLEARR